MVGARFADSGLASTLGRSASSRLMTCDGSPRSVRSVGWPDCFFRINSLSASSYWSSNFSGSKWPDLVSTMCEASSSMSLGIFSSGISSKIFILFAHLIGIARRNPEQALTARFECDDVLAGGEDNPPERNHPFLADRLTNNGERLLADFAIRSEVIRAV